MKVLHNNAFDIFICDKFDQFELMLLIFYLSEFGFKKFNQSERGRTMKNVKHEIEIGKSSFFFLIYFS